MIKPVVIAREKSLVGHMETRLFSEWPHMPAGQHHRRCPVDQISIVIGDLITKRSVLCCFFCILIYPKTLEFDLHRNINSIFFIALFTIIRTFNHHPISAFFCMSQQTISSIKSIPTHSPLPTATAAAAATPIGNHKWSPLILPSHRPS